MAAALRPWEARNRYANFAEGAGVDPACLHDAAVHRRLRAVKAAYDPGDVIHANHAIAPAAG